MAFSLTSHTLFTPRPSIPKPTTPLKTLISKPLSLHLLPRPHSHRPVAGFPLSLCSNKGRFSASLAGAEDSSPITRDGGEDSQNDSEAAESEAAEKNISSLNTTIKAYKEAILDGDEKTISEIEALIYTLENEKDDLVQKVSTLSAAITSGKEKYIRLQADFDNFRKRSEKDRLTTRTDAQGEVIESLFPMVDNFERAKQQIKPETDKEKNINTSYQGIYKQFVEIMRSLHVAAVPTIGKPFDPALHEAIAREESEEFKEGIVIQEFRHGFLLGQRLLRPAMVKVSAGPGRKKTPTITTKNSTGQPAAAAGLDER